MVQQTEAPTADTPVEAPVAPTLDTSIDQPLLSEQDKVEIARNGRTDEDILGAPDIKAPEAPAPTATPDVALLQAAQTKISQYEQWITQARQAQAEQQTEYDAQRITSAVAPWAKQLQERYPTLDEAAAREWASSDARSELKLLDVEKNQDAKQAYAQHFAQQYKVTPESLSQYSSPEAMQLAAESASKMARLEGQIAKMQDAQKAAVPVGQFDSGRSSTGVGVPDQTWLTDVYGTGRSLDHARAAKIQTAMGIFKR